VARAQQTSKVPTIGFLGSTTPASQSELTAAFLQRLRELGRIEGRTVAIEYHSAEGRYDRFPELAAGLVRHQVSVIAVPANTPASLAAKAATRTIPIIFGSAMIQSSLDLSPASRVPGGNATGINFFVAELAAKRLGLLH
jgi:putative tryptophan/tyrosine transport system substrate-binding protein